MIKRNQEECLQIVRANLLGLENSARVSPSEANNMSDKLKSPVATILKLPITKGFES